LSDATAQWIPDRDDERGNAEAQGKHRRPDQDNESDGRGRLIPEVGL
jgi:hypothetical protein